MFDRIRLALGAACLLAATPALADQGVTPDEVRFIQIAAMEGPAAALGTGMNRGLRAAFEEANLAGGVHGRRIVLDSVDDGYEPERSVQALREALAGDAHLGLIGPVGTPTSQAIQPLATEAGLPFIGAFTGAGFLRDPALRNVLNVRASYGAETEAWIAYLADQRGMKNIAILYQDDGFGRVGLAGVEAALERRGMQLSESGTYTRNTTAVKTALLKIRKAQPDAVVMVGAYKPIAEFIRLSRKMDFDPVFVNISFVGSRALAGELGAEGEGVIVSQVVPFPSDASLPVVAEYQAALAALGEGDEPDFVSLEGYITGRIALIALENAGADLDRTAYLAALNTLGSFDLGGLDVSFGDMDNQALDAVFLTRITADGGFEMVPVPGG